MPLYATPTTLNTYHWPFVVMGLAPQLLQRAPALPLHSGMECEAVGASIMNTLVRNPITIPQTCTWRVCVSFLSDFLCIWLPLWSMHTIIIEPCSVLLLSHELRLNTYFLWFLASVYFYFFAFSVSFVIHFFIFLIICCRVSRGFQLDDCRCLFEVWQNSKAKRKRKLAHACPITRAKHGVCITNCSACIAEYQRNL